MDMALTGHLYNMVIPVTPCSYTLPCSYNSNLFILCYMYYHIRREFKRKAQFFNNNNNQTALTGPQIRVAWTVFAETFQVEASQARLHCRRFSVASFLRFLQHNSEFASCTVSLRPDDT